MPSLQLSNRLIWFAHCPKSGGTSVEQFMVSRWGHAVGHLHWGWDRWWRQGGWRLASPPNSPQHLVWKDASAVLDSPPDIIFALVRDPVARMTSEQRWQRQRRGTYWGRVLAWLPFPIWIRLMLAAAAQHPHSFDNHFRAQSEFIPDDAHVFRLEDGLAPVLSWLSDIAGGPEPEAAPPHALSSGRHAAVHPRERSLIARRFAEDYRRFDYPEPNHSPEDPVAVRWLFSVLARVVVSLDRRGHF